MQITKFCDVGVYEAESRQCVCPSGGVYIKSQNICVPVRDRVVAQPCDTCYGNPIFPEQGIKAQSFTAGWQPWSGLKLTYNSTSKLPYAAGAAPFLRSDPDAFGPLWTGSFDKLLFMADSGGVTLVNASRGSGNWTSFFLTANGAAPVGGVVKDRLAVTAQGYLYWDAQRLAVEEYDARGRLLRATAHDGRRLSMARSGLGTVTPEMAEEGLPMSLTDHFGRKWTFEYASVGAEASSRIAAIVDPGQQRVTIAYGSNGQVSRIEWPDGTAQQMVYDRGDLPWALTGYLDENGVRAGTYGYDAQGRAVSTQRALGLDAYSVTWSAPPVMLPAEWYDPIAGVVWRDHVLQAPQDTVVALPSGQSQSLQSVTSFGASTWTAKSQAAGAGSPAVVAARLVDAHLNVTRFDDFNGNRSCMNYDMSRNLETSRVEGLTAAVDCASVASTLPAGARKVSTQWHPDWPLAVKTAEPRRITTLVYNGQPDPFNANAVASCAPVEAKLPDGKPIVVLCKRVEQATTDEAGGQGFNAALQSGVPARATRWTYNATGQVLTETDSRGKVITTNAYYTDTTADHTIGDLKSTANAKGHLTHFIRYNAYGQPLEMVDANGTSTSYAYDLRQRLTSTTTAGKVTSYEYWPTGLLKKSTQPDGSAVSYEYDDAHRLIAVSDTLGNRIAYALDASGNRTKEDAKDPQGALKRSMNRAFDALGRAQQATGRE
ncbi:RHS repeat domain-containing protein [Roseateles sp. MS654]|uniref:RHS repeat domain-containing protein n=1 Tax=Roseateles sp. MS654 TaxID=3412685 RepID=UPI003C2B3580